MNVRIFWVRAMKCMCAQTRPRFTLSSEGVLGGMEFEPMLTPREKSPLPENVPRGVSNPRHCGSEPKHYQLSYSSPPTCLYLTVVDRKSAGSTDICPYISKYRPRVSRKYGNHDVNECEFVASEADRRALMELSFVYICIFQAIPRAEVYGWSSLVQKFC